MSKLNQLSMVQFWYGKHSIHIPHPTIFLTVFNAQNAVLFIKKIIH